MKCWRVTSAVDKARVARAKKKIQSELRKEIVVIDKPLPGVKGTTTDGNTARRLFISSDIFPSVTGVTKLLIDRLSYEQRNPR